MCYVCFLRKHWKGQKYRSSRRGFIICPRKQKAPLSSRHLRSIIFLFIIFIYPLAKLKHYKWIVQHYKLGIVKILCETVCVIPFLKFYQKPSRGSGNLLIVFLSIILFCKCSNYINPPGMRSLNGYVMVERLYEPDYAYLVFVSGYMLVNSCCFC